MVNLISNAVKFCEKETGAITIELMTEEDRIQVNVKDNGIGISPENQKVIFETFQQVRDTARGRPPGSGLGLSIAKRIIDFHHGHIWVTSELGKGATFSFTIPLPKEKWAL
jgi:signal transduction histidine kinase